jgi:hypothetical protein
MTQNTAMKGEKIYAIELDLTGVTDYGMSMDALLTGGEAIPLQGARFDLAVDGRSKGRLAGRARGVDYLRIRADGRMELNLHLTVETDDGRRIALLATAKRHRETESRYSTSLETSGSPPPPKNTHGSMSGRSGVLGPRAWPPGRFTPKPSCNKGGIAQEITHHEHTSDRVPRDLGGRAT